MQPNSSDIAIAIHNTISFLNINIKHCGQGLTIACLVDCYFAFLLCVISFNWKYWCILLLRALLNFVVVHFCFCGSVGVAHPQLIVAYTYWRDWCIARAVICFSCVYLLSLIAASLLFPPFFRGVDCRVWCSWICVAAMYVEIWILLCVLGSINL